MIKEEEKIDCIILCGGKGRRLGSRGEKTNKTMIKIQGYPLIHYLINYLKKNNINNIILPLGFKGSSIKSYLIKTFNKDLCLSKNIIIFNAGTNTSIRDRIKKSIKYLSILYSF